MTIRKLHVEVGNVVQPEPQNTQSSNPTFVSDGTIQQIPKLRQRKATVTLSLIRLFINRSIVPTLITIYSCIWVLYLQKKHIEGKSVCPSL